MARYQPRHKRSKTFARTFISAAVFVAVLFSFLVAFRTDILELALASALGRQGLGPVKVSVIRAGLSGVELDSMTLADGALTLSNAQINYSWASLSDQRFNELRINDLVIRGTWTERGLFFGPFEQIASRADKSPAINEPAEAAKGGDKLPFDIIEIENARISITHPHGRIDAITNLNLNASNTPVAMDASIRLNGPNLSGAATLQGKLNLSDVFASSLKGNLTLQSNTFRIPGVDQTISTDILVDASLDDGVLSVSSDRSIEVSGPWPDTLVPGGIESTNEESFDLSLKTSSLETPFFQLQKERSGLKSTIDFDMDWVTPYGRGGMGAAGWALVGQDGLPQDFTFDRLAVRVNGARTPIGTVWAKLSADGLHGPRAIAEGPITMSARIQSGSLNEVAYTEINVNAETYFRLDGLSLAFALGHVATEINDFTYGDTVRLASPLIIGLAQSGPSTQTTTIVFGAEGNATATLDAAFEVKAPDISIFKDNSALSLSADIPVFLMEGYWVGTGDAMDMRVEVQRAEVQSELAWLTNVGLIVSGGLDDFDGQFEATIRKPAAQRAGRPGVMLNGTFELEENTLISKGVMNLSSDNKLGSFSILYDLNDESGRVSSNIGPLLFGGRGLTPANLRPLALPFTPTSGEFAATATFPIGKEQGAPQTGALFLKDIEIEGGYYRLSRLNSAITLDAIWPPRTTGSQIASIGMLQVGLPVTDVVASFAINSAEIIDVETLSMTFAGGNVSGAPFSLFFNDKESTAELAVSGVALSALARMSGLPGLEAMGTLSGRIPIRIGRDDVFIDTGMLTTTSPGSIRYRPDEATRIAASSQGGMALALQALEDFQYESIAVKVSGSARKELQASLAIKGHNPALYDGYPIDFNLNLNGELANVVRDSMVGYRVPETIKQQLMAFPPQQ